MDAKQKARLNRAKARVRHLVNQGVKFNPKAASPTLMDQARKNASYREYHGLGLPTWHSERIKNRKPRAARAKMHGYSSKYRIK